MQMLRCLLSGILERVLATTGTDGSLWAAKMLIAHLSTINKLRAAHRHKARIERAMEKVVIATATARQTRIERERKQQQRK